MFARAPALSKMLAYICEMHFAGQAPRLKEYSIAVEALGRGPDFDPAGDSIVRVEAARLRKHLDNYYSTEGAGHSLQLRIAEVGYAPRFVPVAPRELAPALEPIALEPQAASEPAGAGPEEPEIPAGFSMPSGRKWLALLAISGVILIALLAGGYLRSHPAPAARPKAEQPALASGTTREIRIHAGSSSPRFIDSSGAVWMNDDFYSGGTPFNRPDKQILRTLDQSLYQTGREGNFSYSIPLEPGVYELHLHFAETSYGQNPTIGPEKLRLFDVSVNGKPLLSGFDIGSDAAAATTADEKIFKDISPASDGRLHLEFSTRRNEASLNGIEILPGTPGKALPIRIVCSPRAYYDQRGRFWMADNYFQGGHLLSGASPVISAADDPGIYASNRWGNFSYSIPVADGTYRLTLKFAEPRWTGSAEDGDPGRMFDIYCNGHTLANRLDVFKEAGGQNKAMELTFHGLKPSAQNKLLLSFNPVHDYAILYAIEVEDESPSGGTPTAASGALLVP